MADVTVVLNCGTLIGANAKTDNGFEYKEFLQIPYAKPPVRELRFKNPQPSEGWIGIRDATKVNEKNISYQFDIMTKTPKGSEDCLYLNVYTPRLLKDDQKLLPVMVYIHGGGFALGSGIIKSESGPDFLIGEDVVIVSINYRVGIFGFLSLDIPEASGNMGLKDQVMALKWVQNNIEKFGGDKDNVTLFGPSAGGASIDYLILSPLSKGLFKKAAVQSGSALNPWALDDNTIQLSIKAAMHLGFEGPADNIQEIHKYLMNQPTEALGNVAMKINPVFGRKLTNFGFVPCIEKNFGSGEEFITDYPYKLLEQGLFNRVTMLRGFCEYEGNTMASFKPQNVDELKEHKNFVEFLSYKFDEKAAEEYNEKFWNAYMGSEQLRTENGDKSLVEFLGDYDFSSGVWMGSKLMAIEGTVIYSYIFVFDGKLNLSKVLMPKMADREISLREGASHADDIGYLLQITGNEAHDYTETDLLVQRRMVKMWTDFAKTGNPTPNTNNLTPIQWPLFTVDQQQYLRIDEELTMESKYHPERMIIFEELYKKFKK